MKVLKTLMIVLLATFGFTAVNAQGMHHKKHMHHKGHHRHHKHHKHMMAHGK